MKLQLNLIENSLDFLINSLDLYSVTALYDSHDATRCNVNDMIKLKLAFIALVQAVELLLKESLTMINQNLIFTDIDSLKEDRLTIGFHQAVNRVNAMNNGFFEDEENTFLNQCARIRNQSIHNRIDITSEELHIKFCKLFCLYKKYYEQLLHTKLSLNKGYENHARNIESFDNNWTFYRGAFVRKIHLEIYKKEIRENENFQYYITSEGEKFTRIRYGDDRFYHHYDEDLLLPTCHDCDAKPGEYHITGCDMEVCPKCKTQQISCGCMEKIQNLSGITVDIDGWADYIGYDWDGFIKRT